MTGQTLQEVQILLAAFVVLFLPGYAWQAWFPHPERDFPSQLAQAVALSVSFTGLVALVAFVVGLRFTSPLVVALYSVAAAFALVGRLRQQRALHLPITVAWTGIALVIWVLWRLYQARTLVLPAWVDSVHHVLIVQVIMQKGGIPADLTPYLPVPFYYHFGFHILAADLAFWSRLPPAQAVLFFGQILNALIGLSVFALVMQAWQDWKRAAAAGLLVTFAFHMPAYYLTWGRYTLLAGLLILPLGMSTALEIYQKPGLQKEAAARLALYTAGLIFCHYLTAAFLAIFLLVLGIARLWGDLRQRSFHLGIWTGLILGGALGVLLAFPWLLRVWQYSANSFHVEAVLGANAPDQTYFPGYAGYLIYLSGPWRNHFLLILAGVGLLFALRKSAGRTLAAWGLILGLLSLPWGLRIGPFRPDYMVIILFLPASLLVADVLVSGGEAARRVFRQVWSWPLPSMALLGLCLWGIVQTKDILNPVTVLATQDDLTAIQWVQTNTSQDARFLINTTPWLGSVYRGTDGGWWLQPLTGRITVLPTVIYDWGQADYVSQINDWSKRASQIKTCSSEFWTLMVDAKLDYVYVHEGMGSLQPSGMNNCADVKEVYHQGSVWIYRID